MKTIEQVFLDTKEIFKKQAADALDEIYTSYLPYVENDTCCNVEFRTQDVLERFFSDNLWEGDKIDLTRYSMRAARDKIFEENKAEIMAAIGKDLAEEVASLKEQLNAAYRRY